MQKSYATPSTLSLSVRIPGKTLHLVFGKGNHYEGVGISEKAPSSQIRVRDRLLEYFRSSITSTTLMGVVLADFDRIITLKYSKYGKTHYLSLFYYGRKSYMAHSENLDGKWQCFLSWEKKKRECENHEYDDHIQLFDTIRKKGSVSIDKESQREPRLFPIETIWEAEEQVALMGSDKAQRKNQAKRERKINYIKKDLETARKWKLLQDWVLSQSPESNELKDGKITFEGIKFNLGFGKKYFEKTEIIFQKSKRLKKACLFLEERLLNEISPKDEQVHSPKKILRNSIEIEWGQKETNTPVRASGQNHEIKFVDYEGVKYGVGLNAEANDSLRADHSQKGHWWFHLENGPSPHIVAFTESFSEDVILFASYLMWSELKKNKPDMAEIDIVYTQIKNLKSVKGHAGKVLIKKEKKRRLYIDEILKKVKMVSDNH